MSDFQKRHYEAIALVCQEYNDHASIFQNRAQRFAHQAEFEARLCNMFLHDNPNFNRERFLRACVPGANVKNRPR